MKMTTLLTLPREIRDQIILQAVSHVRPAPVYTNSDARHRTVARDVQFKSRLKSRTVMYESNAPVPAASGLLAANRQLRQETLLALGQKTNCVLDVMFVNEFELWPTWLSVPRATRYIDTVDVTFRVKGTMGHSGEEESSDTNMWLDGIDGYQSFGWVFYDLLERFLKAGPIGPAEDESLLEGHDGKKHDLYHISDNAARPHSRAGDVDRAITVKTIVLNFVSCPEDESRIASADRQYAWFSCREGRNGDGNLNAEDRASPMREQIMQPLWLAECVDCDLSYLLRFKRGLFGYGSLLYERVGQFIIKVNGATYEQYDLASQLACMFVDFSMIRGIREDDEHSQYLTTEKFNSWRVEAMQLRQRAGLPVMPIWHPLESSRA